MVFAWATLLVGFFVLVALAMLARRLAKLYFIVRGKRADPLQKATCVCGYDLSKLDRARCPECGRVRYFDATPEELGLSDDELRRLTEAHNRRDQEERRRWAKETLEQ